MGKWDKPHRRQTPVRKQKDEKALSQRFDVVKRAGIGALTLVMVLILLFSAIVPERYKIEAGDIAPETMYATRDIRDEITTQARMDEAVAAVAKKYNQDETVSQDVLKATMDCLAAMAQARNKAETEKTRLLQQRQQDANASNAGALSAPDQIDLAPTPPPVAPVTIEDLMALPQFVAELKASIPVQLSNEQLRAVLEASEEQWRTFTTFVPQQIEMTLQGGVKEDMLRDQVSRLVQEVSKGLLTDALNSVAGAIIRSTMRANLLYEEEATNLAKQQAAAGVEPKVYRKTEVVVEKGKAVSAAQLAVLDTLGMLEDRSIDTVMLAGFAFIVIALLFAFAAYLYYFEKTLWRDSNKLLVISIILILTLILARLLGNVNTMLAPVALGALLVAVLLSPRLAVMFNMIVSVLAGLILGDVGNSATMLSSVLMVSMLGGTVGVLFVQGGMQRLRLFAAGGVVGLVNFFVCFVMSAIQTTDYAASLTNSLWGIGAGLCCGVIALGTIPMWESIFHILTPIRLLELSNPNNPLLKQLLVEAPGTYHHSVLVANMAETAALEIGANALLTRVGADYHDVGKIKRPYFFRENQLGSENPHDKILPELSALIITSHPKDGKALAQKYKLPAEIQDMIVQHHGTTPVVYFYHKALTEDGGDTINAEDFRYPGPKPQTREAAILMLADTVEAAVRTLSDVTRDNVEDLIAKLVKEKLDDGQLSDCELTMKDLEKIKAGFLYSLRGIYHERIEYPDVDMEKLRGEKDR